MCVGPFSKGLFSEASDGFPSLCNVSSIPFSEIPAREGWVCDFESGQICLNFRMSGWVYFSPVQHSADTQYEPEVDHTSGRDTG